MVGLRAVSLDSDGDGLCKSTLREIKLLSQLRHQHIVRLLEIVKDKNVDFASNYTSPSGQHCSLTVYLRGSVEYYLCCCCCENFLTLNFCVRLSLTFKVRDKCKLYCFYPEIISHVYFSSAGHTVAAMCKFINYSNNEWVVFSIHRSVFVNGECCRHNCTSLDEIARSTTTNILLLHFTLVFSLSIFT